MSKWGRMFDVIDDKKWILFYLPYNARFCNDTVRVSMVNGVLQHHHLQFVLNISEKN